MEQRRFRRGCERRDCRPYLQGGRVRSKAMDVDIDVPAPSNATARLCRHARGCDGSIRQELAPRVSDIRDHRTAESFSCPLGQISLAKPDAPGDNSASAQMPTDTQMFLAMAVLGLAATLVLLKWLV
jgi:hypothetical protein